MDKAGIKIDEEILQKTAYCEHNFSCLSGVQSCMCEDDRSLGYGMLEINPKYGADCKYHVTFGNTSFCICPTRNEIFKRYNL
jgi:hypothetical protein